MFQINKVRESVMRKAGGSRKGIPNKTTVIVKDAIQSVYNNIGGDEAFKKWAKKNPDLFYTKIFVKLLPTKIDAEITGKDGGPLIGVWLGDLTGGGANHEA